MTMLTAQDEGHLRLFPLLHLGMGLMLVTGTFDSPRCSDKS
jgi:hypothetical protein